MSNTPHPPAAVEGAALLMNQVFMLIGYLFWGWTLQELLFFYWIEPIMGLLLLAYLDGYLPLRMGLRRFSQVWHWLFLGLVWWLFTWALGAWLVWSMATFSLEWLAVLGLFALILALPIVQQWRAGLMPTKDGLPLQLRTLMHPLQILLTPTLVCAALFLLPQMPANWLVAALLGTKTLVELALWRSLKG